MSKEGKVSLPLQLMRRVILDCCLPTPAASSLATRRVGIPSSSGMLLPEVSFQIPQKEPHPGKKKKKTVAAASPRFPCQEAEELCDVGKTTSTHSDHKGEDDQADWRVVHRRKFHRMVFIKGVGGGGKLKALEVKLAEGSKQDRIRGGGKPALR